MEMRVKEVVEYIRKYLLFSLKSTYKLSCRHPFVSSFAFSLFLLYSCYPSLFAFLVSSFPVLSCTALLLGILLSYGEPNIPEIEENDKINQEVSSLKVENSVDDLFVKKDRSFTLEDLVDSRVGIEERISKAWASSGENEREIDFTAVGSSVEEGDKIMENLKGFMNKQSESYMRTSKVADSVSEGNEGLMVKIKKPELDDWLDSSLGSPWQPINIRDASSDSESDLAESSSPDASMTDILPMLDELSPLLDSETPNASKSADNSDLEFSQHHESDEESMEKEDEYKTEEKDENNNVVTWSADDQKNVMDLGSSDLERNRRLESLIARRRARKNQIIIYEKDLIDLHNDTIMDKLFHLHPQIPPIFAPRRNPFDFPYDTDESKELPPIPGSAPSVLLRRQNPFDFLCDSEDSNKGLEGESLRQPEFGLPSQRGYLFKRHESFASYSAFPSNLMHEKLCSSRLNPYIVAQKMDSEGNDYTDFHNQLSDTKSSSAATLNTVSSAMDPEDKKVPTEEETQEGIALLVPLHHTKPTEQYSQFYEEDLVDSQPELDDHSVDPNASAVPEETYQGIDASGFVKKTIEEIQFGQNHEVVEEKHDDLTLFSSSERIEKNLDVIIDEVLETQEQTVRVSKASNESTQSSDASANHQFCETEGVNNNQAAVPIYDSSPSGSGTFSANIPVPDDNLISLDRRDVHSFFTVESHVQEDEMENMTSEVFESKAVHGSKLQDSTSSSGENVTFFTNMNLLDENILASMGVSETGEQDFNEIGSPGIDEVIGDLATSLDIDHSSSLSSVEVDNELSLTFSVGYPPSEVEEKHQSMELFEMQTSFRTYHEECCVSNLELGPILEENSEDFKVEEEHRSLVQTKTAFASTELQTLEGSDVILSSVGQEVVSLHNQSKEEARDEGNEAKPSKTPNLVSANDDMFTGVVIEELFDSMELSSQSKMMSEPEFTSNDDISDSQDNIINEFQINQDVILTNLNDSYSEHGELNVDVREIQVIDEHLLSELDAVGDFQVEELKCQECLHMESRSDSRFVCSGEDPEFISAHVTEMSPNKPISTNLINPDEMDLVLNQEEPTDSGYWSFEMAPVEDLTVYNPKLNVLEAYSVEELDSIFKEDHPGELVEPPLSETIAEKLVAEKPYIGLSELDKVDQEIESVPHETVLFTSTEKNAEEISLALIEDGRDFDISASQHFDFDYNDNHSSMDGCKSDLTVLVACGYDSTESQSSEIKADHVKSVMSSTSELISHPSAIAESETSSGELDISSRDFEIEETDSDLIVLEAKSIEDIHSIFKHVTEIVANQSISPLISPEPLTIHPVDTVVEALPPEVDKTSGLLVLEAKSVEDINAVFKQAAEEDLASVFCFSDPDSMKTRPDFEVVEPSSHDAENLSELFVPEARSAEDIQLVFKQATEKVSAMPTFLLIDPESSKTNQDHDVVEALHPKTHNYTDLLVHQEKPSEDIDSAFDQADVDLGEPTSEVYPVLSVNLIDSEVVDVKYLETQIDPELLVPDAKYVEGIDFSLKSSSEGGLLRSTLLEIESNHDAVKNGSLQTSTSSEQLVLEAESVDEKSPTLKQVTEGLLEKSCLFVDPDAEGTSEVVSLISLGQENDSDMPSPETKSFQHLNSACKQDIEVDLVQSNLPEFGNFQPDHDAVEAKTLNGIDEPEPFVLESKSFEQTHSDSQEDVADFIGQSTTALVDLGYNPGQEFPDLKSPDSSNVSDFPALEARSLANLNLAFRQAIEGCFSKAESEVDTEHDSVGKSFHATEKYSELIVLEEKSTEDIQPPFSDARAGVHEVSSSLSVYPEPMEIHPVRKVEDIICFELENNSKMLVVEAKSPEDITSAFKQATDVATSPLLIDPRSPDIQIESSSLVLEAKSIELTDSSLKKVHQDGSKKPTFFTDPPLQANLDDDLEMLVLEENSVEDIDSTFAQVTEGNIHRPVTLQDDSKQTEIIPEPKPVTDSNLAAKQDTEVDYAKETIVASNENSSSEDQSNRKTDGKEASPKDPSASTPPPVKIKKKKFEKSDSSSSSSSSSSDSE